MVLLKRNDMKAFNYLKRFIFVLFSLFLISLTAAEEDIVKSKNILGDPNAPNILVEYASLSCVHCANFHNKKLPEIKDKLTQLTPPAFLRRFRTRSLASWRPCLFETSQTIKKARAPRRDFCVPVTRNVGFY